MTGTERMPPGSVRDQVLAWLNDQEPGANIHYVGLADELMLKDTSVGYTLSRLARRPDDPDDPVLVLGLKSGWYRLVRRPGDAPRHAQGRRAAHPALPAAPEEGGGTVKAGDLLEVIGTAANGRLLLRDDRQKLWRAEELEL